MARGGVRGEEEMGSDHCDTGICDPHTNRSEPGVPSFLLTPFSLHDGGNRVLQSKLPPTVHLLTLYPQTPGRLLPDAHTCHEEAHTLPQRRVTGVIISRQITASASLAADQGAAA